MMKTNLLKTLLAAVLLCVGGSNAWADGTKRTLHAQNYEAASNLSDWTAWSDDMKSLATGDATYGKYAQINIGSTAANRGAYKTITPAFTFGSGYTTAALTTAGYNVEFDLKIRSGSKNARSHSDFVVPTAAFTTTTGYYSGSTYVFSLSQPTRDADTYSTTWYINDVDNSTGSTVSLTYNDWYHVKLVLTASSVAYTITNNSTSASVATGSKTVESLPSIWGLWTAVGRQGGFTYIDNIDIYDYSASESVTSPTISSAYAGAYRTVTISSGTSSLSNTVKTYYTVDGSAPTSTSTEYTTPLTITENCTVKAISISSTSVASPVSDLAVTVGKIDLAIPSITASGFSNTTGVYVTNPTFNFTCDNSAILGTPTATLSYTFTPEGGDESAATVGTSFTPTTKGTLKVIASHDDYNSSEKTLVISNRYSVSFTGRDYTTATTSDISTTEGVWGAEFDVDWDGWASGLKANLRQTDMSDDYRFRISNPNTINYVSGWGWVRSDKSYNYQSRYATEGYFVGLKVNSSKGYDVTQLTYPTVYCASGTGESTNTVIISVAAGNLVQQLYFYEAATVSDVDLAIADCKKYDKSSAFATALAGESFASVAEVYAFNTTYHITNGVVTDGKRDITGVIRNAAVADATDWDGASIASGEKYTGAPDENYLDKNTGSIDASQTIYGLPAGVYVLKAATRAKAETSGNIYVWDGTNTTQTAINADGNTGGTLDRGWSWTEVKFTLTSTANVKIGFWANVDGYWASCDDWHLYKVESVSPTIGADGYATYSSSYALDFVHATGVKGYYTTTASDGNVTMTKITGTAAAGEGLFLKKTGETVSIPVVASGDALADNKLKATDGSSVAASVAGTYHYVFAKQNEELGFYNMKTALTIAAGKAYLETTTDIKAHLARITFSFDDEETTGINNLTPALSEGEGVVYNLRGQRVAQPAKGLYIKNGKKIVVK